MDDFIIGTAGHVDHGKTTLIKALTKIDTDRTPQEKERGLSIELGFAHIDLKSGKRVGIVDVPGHESFLKNMVAGAVGMDLVLLVVDVNEGVMPQTREHLMILKLLDVQDIVVVMTKIKDVPSEKIISCRIDIENFLESFGFKSATTQIPIIPVDGLANIGIDDLKAEIEKYALSFVRKKITTKISRLNVDRSFSLKGVGTIVTGTLLSGTLTVGDEIWVYPLQKKVKMRQLQVHDSPVKYATEGQRVAIQLSGVKVSEIPKGSVLSSAENIQATYMVNTQITNIQRQTSLTHWQRVHLHVGTQTVQARLVPLNQEEVAPYQSDFVQLRLEQPIITFPGDRFILRSYSPVTTIAGGVILNTTAIKSHRNEQPVIEELTYRVTEDYKSLVWCLLNEAEGMLTIQQLYERSQLEDSVLKAILSRLKNDKQLIVNQDFIMTKNVFSTLKQAVLTFLDEKIHSSETHQGITLTDLFREFSTIPSSWLEYVLTVFIEDEVVVKQNDLYTLRHQNHSARVEWLTDLEAFLNQQGLKATAWEELKKNFPDITLLDSKEKQQYLYFVDRHHVVGVTHLNKKINQVIDYLEKNQTISIAECRDMLAINRQQSLQLLEAMDKQGWTKRMDNKRRLVRKR